MVEPAGIGYGDDDDSTVLTDMQSEYISVYMRRSFNVEDHTQVTGLTLAVNYDDGFVAYINGTEVARRKRIKDGDYYDTIEKAYLAAGNGDDIQVREESFGAMVMNRAISIGFVGGYDCYYLVKEAGPTQIDRRLTISAGSVIVENIMIQ